MKKNKYLIKSLIVFLTFLSLCVFSFNLKAEPTNLSSDKKKIDIYVFTQESCKNCAKMKEYLNGLDLDYVTVHYYDYESTEYGKLYEKMKEVFVEKGTAFGFPFTIIGGKYYIGYNDYIAKSIRKYITIFSDESYSQKIPYHDIIKMYQNGEEIKDEYLIKDKYNIPLIGEVDAKNANLFFVSIILGFLDGINPCGMWILLFILSLLIPTNDKKKIWILGGTFILTSGIFYFILMMAWINLMGLFDDSKILLIVTGIFALAFGGYNIYKYIRSRIKKEDGCDVQSASKQRKMSKKLKKIITNEKLWLAVVGIIGITITVNLVEVACSAGWPAIFSNMLVASHVTTKARFGYTLLYVFFFLIDDIIVFTIALCTLKVKAISNVLTKYAHLIGGILMIIFGILMIFFPDFVTMYL